MTYDERLKLARSLKFGDRIINGYASDDNPLKIGTFVELKERRHKNRYGITHTDRTLRLTNGKGKFWDLCLDALDVSEVIPC